MTRNVYACNGVEICYLLAYSFCSILKCAHMCVNVVCVCVRLLVLLVRIWVLSVSKKVKNHWEPVNCKRPWPVLTLTHHIYIINFQFGLLKMGQMGFLPIFILKTCFNCIPTERFRCFFLSLCLMIKSIYLNISSENKFGENVANGSHRLRN